MKKKRARAPTVRRNHHLSPGQPCFHERDGRYGEVKQSWAPDTYAVEWWDSGLTEPRVDGRHLRPAYFGPALVQLARSFLAEVQADYRRGAITRGQLGEAERAVHAALVSDEDMALIAEMRSYALHKRGG